MRQKILVVDDEVSLVDLLVFNLKKAGFDTVVAYDGIEALNLARDESPDLVILDVMLPGIDGFEVCKALRKETLVPILMLTARKDEVDKVVGLELGADDYVTKPFSPRELVARVKAILRRTSKEAGEGAAIRAGRVLIDVARRKVYVDGKEVDLTYTEFELLRYLASRPGYVFSRDFLLQNLWGYDYAGDTRTVDVHIRHIREKLEKAGAAGYVETVRGVGYRMVEAP